MDGTNIADISDKAPSSLSGVLLGVDTVQEFSVQTHGYSAEFGRAAGGIMSAVTKSGTNRLRGSAYEFHRNDSLDSQNYFASGDLPDFQRDQYGGSLGGPIFKNKLFFFGAYEALRERNAVTRFARLPNALAHQGFVPVQRGADQRRRQPEGRALPVAALSDPGRSGFRRRHRGTGAFASGPDRRAIRRGQVRLQPRDQGAAR